MTRSASPGLAGVADPGELEEGRRGHEPVLVKTGEERDVALERHQAGQLGGDGDGGGEVDEHAVAAHASR